MAVYEITVRIDVPETKAGKPTASGRRIAEAWSAGMSTAFERISCGDDLNEINAPCFAATYEGWVKP